MRIAKYNYNLLPNQFLSDSELECSGLTQAERVARQGGTIGYPAWNLLYYSLLSSLPSSSATIVETGTSHGLTTIVLAQALANRAGGIVHTAEVDPHRVTVATENIKLAGLSDLVKCHLGDGATILRQLALEVIHFAFLDGCHSADAVFTEFEIVRPAIIAGSGMAAFDNANSGPVNTAIQDVLRVHGGNLIRFRNCSWSPPGVALWQP